MKREINANAEGLRETVAPTNAVGPAWLCSGPSRVFQSNEPV